MAADGSSSVIWKQDQRSVPVPSLMRGLVCSRAEMRAWASAGKASSPSGQTISSGRGNAEVSMGQSDKEGNVVIIRDRDSFFVDVNETLLSLSQ